MNIIDIYIKNASVKGLIFSPKINNLFISNLKKENIEFNINNIVFNSYALLKDETNELYSLVINKETPLDYHDVILFSINMDNDFSDKYIMYLHQIFYLGECLNLLPSLSLDTNKDITLTTSLVKINENDLSNITGTTAYLSGLGSTSTISLPAFAHVNDLIPLTLTLKSKTDNFIPDSNYIINIKITKNSP